jgi:5-formyltetrahydrofolate cyclo-ligase
MIKNDNKTEIRKKIQKKRMEISEFNINESGKKIIKKIEKLKEFISAKEICIYFPIKNEINLIKLQKTYPKKNFYLPKTKKTTMEFGIFKDEKELKKGKFNIPEPHTTTKNLIPDIMIIPGLAFDLTKNRIGYGKGFFDKFIKKIKKKSHKTFFIGVAMDFQILKNKKITTENHDQKMDIIITEKNIYQ